MSLAAVPQSTVASAPAETFESRNPATGELIDTWPVHGEAAVREAVATARAAAAWWGGLDWSERARHLSAWKAELARGMHALAEVVHEENGKPHDDAILEITLAVDHIAWAARNAKRVLGSRRVSSGLLAANQTATLANHPFGVVGVIGPWNYPVFTPMGSIAYALAAGNAIVFKPSEYTPGIGAWMVHAWERAVPAQPAVLQLITGLGPTGAALCRAGVDKIAFTGSARTGKLVMAACAENLVPVLMECGGKDALIVDDDADVRAAADAALWGGLSNAGQTCVGIERVYATEPVYDAFVAELTRLAAPLRPGSGDRAAYGPITMPGQIDIIRGHIADALARGGRALLGGADAVHAPYVEPTVLVDVPQDSTAIQEETFGPTLTVTKVRDADEAVRLANDTGYGLAGAVFSGSRRRGLELARAMRSGMTSVNAVLAFAFVPSLPFGGVGGSGFGRIHGDDGLREFAWPKAITRQRFALPVPLSSFRRPARAADGLARVVRLLHGRG
jgi:aldehyde dehydrogenase (NAD+)